MVQRTTRASVTVGGAVVGEVGPGLTVLLGVGPEDDDTTATRLADRVAGLRIFPDESGRMNRDIIQERGEVLVVSQFTLFADTTRGHRPSFVRAAPAAQAERLYGRFVDALRGTGLVVATGRFGAHMALELVNDGPVTIVLSGGEEPWNADAG